LACTLRTIRLRDLVVVGEQCFELRRIVLPRLESLQSRGAEETQQLLSRRRQSAFEDPCGGVTAKFVELGCVNEPVTWHDRVCHGEGFIDGNGSEHRADQVPKRQGRRLGPGESDKDEEERDERY
jgi:hypothetical protein